MGSGRGAGMYPGIDNDAADFAATHHVDEGIGEGGGVGGAAGGAVGDGAEMDVDGRIDVQVLPPYNFAGSTTVGKVEWVNEPLENAHDIPTHSDHPNSVTQNWNGGAVLSERYYDEHGDVHKDIDYTDHGNSKTHPVVPHQHNWGRTEGKLRRGTAEAIS